MSPFEKARRTIQFLAVDAVEKAKSGHPGAPMGLAGIVVELFTRHLSYDPSAPDWPNRDRFVLSCGHASALLYATLHLAGYDVSRDDLAAFRQWGAKTPGHPEQGHTAGVETTTGPLGQGVANGVGMALGSKLLGARLNREGEPALFDYRVFVVASDGDLMEGVSAEAASLAGHLGLGNLVVVYDDNRVTIDGTTELAFTEDVGKRFEAYGWSVEHVDGHAPDEVRGALDRAVSETLRPSLIVARTHIGYGAPTKQDSPEAHGAPLGQTELAEAKRRADWPLSPAFFVPDGADELFRRRAAEGRAARADWQARFDALDAERRAFAQALAERPSAEELLPFLLAGAPMGSDATRSHSAKVEQALGKRHPALVGGSADLASSCKTTLQGGGDVSATDFRGRNLHFGIREHAMGAVANGLALSGWLPFTSTFLVFSDYMRPPMRLAALMRQRVVFVFTHDSIFVGEDGPTHQPIEQVWALRLIPNLDVVRPADGVECAAAWALAAGRSDGPTALILTRQTLPALARPDGWEPASMLEGAYVLSGPHDAAVTLVATGSEVHLALGAAERLAAAGLTVRVVSMPSVTRFLALGAARQAEILGSGARVSLEAGSTLPWRALVGISGLALGLDDFGASAPAERLAEELGLSVEKVTAHVLAWHRAKR